MSVAKIIETVKQVRACQVEDSVSVASVVCGGKNINYLKSYI